jgi:hypothetical protein
VCCVLCSVLCAVCLLCTCCVLPCVCQTYNPPTSCLPLAPALESMNDSSRCPRCESIVLLDQEFGQCSKCFFAFCDLCREDWHPGDPCVIPFLCCCCCVLLCCCCAAVVCYSCVHVCCFSFILMCVLPPFACTSALYSTPLCKWRHAVSCCILLCPAVSCCVLMCPVVPCCVLLEVSVRVYDPRGPSGSAADAGQSEGCQPVGYSPAGGGGEAQDGGTAISYAH